MVVVANCVRPSNVVRSLTAILESKRIDQSCQRAGLLAVQHNDVIVGQHSPEFDAFAWVLDGQYVRHIQ
jgi:hypothetical protein